ncbi:type II secretion system protein [Euhalothece natronophila Z-M001]|uniref:Type II secretion system protein n=1 Tax=Euhalothece natronophila Z-M001 TaxID=522448 RepID=A0A5B8NJG4_9CHRO|nr:prepilin-type N-terminal cleavage/methylation domain-containing protein [Euhalothece natronophila]QDZ38495.1 type II secretion system protein [Euhalothece natronophila Z-M001]
MMMNPIFFYRLHKAKDNSQKGLTLLEVLASIVMIGVILVAVAPPLLLSTATRVKMRRVSQAQSIAQDEVNRVQGIMARSRDQNLPTDGEGDFAGLPQTIDTGELEDFAAPSNLSEVRAVDVNGDGDTDFFVQTFREGGALFSGGDARCEPAIFTMGVRVYSFLAQDNLEEDNLETDPISLQMTSNLQGQSTQPMAVLFAEVSRSDMERSRDAYNRYISGDWIPGGCN